MFITALLCFAAALALFFHATVEVKFHARIRP